MSGTTTADVDPATVEWDDDSDGDVIDLDEARRERRERRLARLAERTRNESRSNPTPLPEEYQP